MKARPPSALGAFVRKELHHILRDRQTLTILLLMPLVQVLMFGYALRTDVRDLRVAFYYERKSGSGPLRVMLSDGRQKFASIITPEEARLVRLDGSGETSIGTAVKLPPNNEPLRIEMANVDFEVKLYINDREVARTTPEQYRPDVARLISSYHRNEQQPRPAVEISAAEQSASVAHLSLWRDICYGNANVRWGTPDRPMHLGSDEFWVLGDNSPLSGDARIWNLDINLQADNLHVPPGRVPARFMLGRAFFVYWPAGFRPGSSTIMPALAPNFGDMRFIR